MLNLEMYGDEGNKKRRNIKYCVVMAALCIPLFVYLSIN